MGRGTTRVKAAESNAPITTYHPAALRQFRWEDRVSGKNDYSIKGRCLI
ncbi:MAG: hypothetical protein PWR22_1733 [Moorella sp. (in: firmicutes)]|nr:hypothetical protein [Moorella sp. (in: firmicutes)]